MINALKKLFGSSNSSKNSAKSRLHFVLVQDRAGLSSEEISQFRKELVSVIEKFFVIDEQGFDINYKRDNDSTTLLINSPIVVRRAKSQAQAVDNGKAKAAKPAAPSAANA